MAFSLYCRLSPATRFQTMSFASWILSSRFFGLDREQRPLPRQTCSHRSSSRKPRLEQLEERTLLAVVAWDGGGGDSNWHNPINWSTDTVPGAADDVEINATVAVTDSDVTVASLSLSGGELTGTADVAVSGLFTWTKGTLSGAGVLNANGGMLLTDGSQFAFKNLDGRTLNNAGTAVWEAGHIVAYNG